MIRKRLAEVVKIVYFDNDVTEILVKVENKIEKAINYNNFTGSVQVGDDIIINTTAVDLSLGTGGYHFVIHNERNIKSDYTTSTGHIMKLRYTPMQLKCLTIEEEESNYHQLFNEKDTIDGMKVLIGSLHSMLLPAIYTIKKRQPSLNITYIMTDSACLPLSFSKTVKNIKKHNLINYTITCGQAFGGDYEAVNIYTALITAKYICKSDIAIVIPGPGVVGTDSKLGFSNIEEGHIIDAVNTLKGNPIVIPRISFADKRHRHQGISHHTITILSKITYSSANIGFPILNNQEKNCIIQRQIISNKIDQRHHIRYINTNCVEIEEIKTKLNTMGRSYKEDFDFFKAVSASAIYCLM